MCRLRKLSGFGWRGARFDPSPPGPWIVREEIYAVLGSAERSHFRLTFSQAFNSLGTVIAPYLGSMLLLRGGVFATHGAAADAASRAASLHNIDTGFLVIAVMIALLALFIWRFSGRLNHSAPPPAPAHD